MLEPRDSRIVQGLIATTFVVGLLFQCDLGESFDTAALMLLGWLAGFIVATGLFIEALTARLRKRPAPHLWTALLLIVGIGPGIFVVNTPFLWISAAHKLLRNKDSYLEAVADGEAGRDLRVGFMYRSGPQHLYCFPWGGIADSWDGIAHDATGSLGRGPEGASVDELRVRLHLWGPWYYVLG